MFQNERLNLARARRGMNKTQLAKAVRLKPITIASYEKGNTVPSEEIVQRLSESLRFPESFFYEELIDALPVDGASFRALTRMTASQRNAALAAGTLCIELSKWIDARFELPESDVPEIDPVAATPAGAAAVVRAAWGLGESPIPHVLHLLESRGVRVFSLVNECREVGAFSFWRGDPFICLGNDKTSERSIFDSAHELGHLVLHRDHAAPRGREAEREADSFASNLLMPKADVEATGLRNPDLAMLAEAKTRWRVSVAALNYRLHELGMISDWHYRELCIEISRLGRRREPNPMAREHSQVLPKVLATLRAEGMKRSDIASALHLYPDDLDALLAGLTISGLDGEGAGRGDAHSQPDLHLV
jgi:Zn-dependent peptidase ImmA (M78 family)/DNA-binding XRE family transcriptional regulator